MLAYYCEFYDFFFLQSAEMLMISCTNYCRYHQHFISSAESMICLIFEIIIIIIMLVWRKPGNVRVNSKDPKKGRSIFSLNQMDELIKNASVEFLSCIREKKGQLWLDRLLYWIYCRGELRLLVTVFRAYNWIHLPQYNKQLLCYDGSQPTKKRTSMKPHNISISTQSLIPVSFTTFKL